MHAYDPRTSAADGHRSMPHLLSSILIVTGWALMFSSGIRGEHAPTPALLDRANVTFAGRQTEDTVHEAIACYEEILPHLVSLPVQSQSFVLNRLAQLCYEATTFSDGFRNADRALLELGMSYGLRSLRLAPAFAEMEQADFGAAVAYVTDAPALLWTANSWAVLCGLDPIQGALQIGKVKILFERCLDVDEMYWGASPHSAMGALLVATPAALGGDAVTGRAHLLRATQLAPGFLHNRVVYAQYGGFVFDALGRMCGIRDETLVREQIRIVLEGPIHPWPLWNRRAKSDAEALLQQLAEMAP